MEIHPLYGVSVPEHNWVPGPRYLLRRERLLKYLEQNQPGRVLEIGCGAATLLYDLQRRGFDCVGVDSSESALNIARHIHRQSGVQIHEQPDSEWREEFDYLCAFEVLEHIENDIAALSEWCKWLKPGGRVLLSVPAHQWRFSGHDRWAGHFRRYSSRSLRALCRSAGLEVERLECYGFPAADLIEALKLSALRGHYTLKPEEDSAESKRKQTAKSGTERSMEARLYPLQKSAVGRGLMRSAFLIQRLFLNTPLGGGYLICARKPVGGGQANLSRPSVIASQISA